MIVVVGLFKEVSYRLLYGMNDSPHFLKIEQFKQHLERKIEMKNSKSLEDLNKEIRSFIGTSGKGDFFNKQVCNFMRIMLNRAFIMGALNNMEEMKKRNATASTKS
jgi:hypothetical protein